MNKRQELWKLLIKQRDDFRELRRISKAVDLFEFNSPPFDAGIDAMRGLQGALFFRSMNIDELKAALGKHVKRA